MRLFFAGASTFIDVLREEGVKNVLVAYPEVARDPGLLERFEGLEVFLDCGAWSVASGAIPPIDVKDYIAWLRRARFPFHAVASLDVIGDPLATARNYKAMRDAGFDVLPTWHVGSPALVAKELAHDATYLAVGGIAAKRARGSQVVKLVQHVWPYFKNRKVHLFGVAAVSALATLRPYSADMTGWLVGARFGEVYTLTTWPTVRNFDITRRGSEFNRIEAAKVTSELARYGTTWRDLDTSDVARVRHNIRILLEAERRINAWIDAKEPSP